MKAWLGTLFIFISFFSLGQDSLQVKWGTEPVMLAGPPVKTEENFQGKVIFHLRSHKDQELQLAGKSLFLASAAGGVGIAAYGFVDEPLRNFTLQHRTEETSEITQYIEPLGNSKYMILASALVYVSGVVIRDPKMQRLGLLLASGMLANDYVTKKLKNEFQRYRPGEADHNSYFAGGEGGRHHLSFPSAHTSTAFAFATSVATVYSDHKWVTPVAYAGATLVGLSRIHDNKHWATDVMAGAAVGYLITKTTNVVLQQVEGQLEKKKINIHVSPRVSTATAGVNLGLTF